MLNPESVRTKKSVEDNKENTAPDKEKSGSNQGAPSEKDRQPGNSYQPMHTVSLGLHASMCQ